MAVVVRVLRLGRKRDRRSLIATLTPAGRKLIDHAIEARFSEASSAVSRLGNSEWKQLAELLRKLEAKLGAIPQQE